MLYKYKDSRELLVPHEMQNKIIQMAHSKGHFSIMCTEEAIKQEYYVPKLAKKIENVIANWAPCILGNKSSIWSTMGRQNIPPLPTPLAPDFTH